MEIILLYFYQNIIALHSLGIFIKIPMKFVVDGPTVNISIGWALAKVMTWYQAGNKSLYKPKLTKIPDTTWHHYATVS